MERLSARVALPRHVGCYELGIVQGVGFGYRHIVPTALPRVLISQVPLGTQCL